MIDKRSLSEEPDRVREALARRGASAAHVDLDALLALAARRLESIKESEALRSAQNRRQQAVKDAPKGTDEFRELVSGLRGLSDQVKAAEAERKQLDAELEVAMLEVPNLPDPAVPDGASEESNPTVREVGDATPREGARAHDEIGTALGILDFESAAKVSGARFVTLVGAGARLERGLISYMLDLHTREHGYTEVMPPFLVNRAAMTGTGQLPKFEDDSFRTDPDDLFLVPTAEVPVTNLRAGEILDGADLPLRYAAYTPCFRREAGSYGQDTKGLIRLHQFNKVELVWFTAADQSEEAHEQLVGHAEAVLRGLSLPYRVVELCAGDLGFGAARCYDIEVWFPSQQRYREISSCSNYRDYQARRANIRQRPAPGDKPRLCHTLNGSGLAVGRCMAAILENHVQDDGSVRIPEPLRPYLGGMEHIGP